MRRIIFAAAAAAAVVVVPVAGGAQASPNDHNCVGVTDSSLAGPGFGQTVSDLAHSAPGAVGAVLEGFANCGNTGRP
jgi:hypothetical protein